MKYLCTIDIERPIEEVVNLWKDESHFGKWQDGFVKIEHLSGDPETPGAKSKILFEQGKNKMELIETIMISDLPREKKALYEHIHMINTQSTRFESISENKTRYISEVEYTQFNKFMIKLMAKLFPGMFKKQSLKWMQQFKNFAERQ